MRIVIGVIAIIISFILIAAAMWEFFNTEDEEMNEEKYGDSYGEQFRKLEEENAKLKAQIEKMKCCGNCGNERCTSKYRGNAAYHRQTDGFACADNEEWKIKDNHTCNNCKHYSSQYELCCYSMGDSDYDCRGRKWEIKEK